MSFNLIDATQGLFNHELVGKTASLFGENEAGVQKAVGAIVPSVFTAVLNKVGSGDAQGVLGLVKNAATGGVAGNLAGLFSGESASLLSRGEDFAKGLFGDRFSGLADAIAGFSGISRNGASSLLSVATPAALGELGKHAADSSVLTSAGLLSFLNTQKDNIVNAVPSGLNLAGALGIGSLAGLAGKFSGALSSVTGGQSHTPAAVSHAGEAAAEPATGGIRWLLPMLLAILCIGLVWYFARSCNTSKTPDTVVADSAIAKKDTVAVPAATTPEMLRVKLPDGVELEAYKGGIEDKLVTFLNDPASKAGKDVWFDFDNLNFKIGSAEITNESQKQVANITAILKAYPKLKIKIGGYTDKTGDSLANIKLSQSRAEAVFADLKKTGAAASQLIGAEGYGSQFAKAAATAPDAERKLDRRISIGVREK